MKNLKFLKTLFVICLYFLIYLIATMFQSNFWGDILSPIGAVLSFEIIFQVFLKQKGSRSVRGIWLLFSLACLSWAIADILWAVYDLVLHSNPESSTLISIFYIVTTMLMFIAVLIFSVYKFRRWNAIQLIIDSMAISVSCLFLLWILFFDKDFEMLNRIGGGGWICAISVALDFTMFVGISVWYLSIRGGKIPTFLGVTASALFLYAITDIFYYYLYLNHKYIPNSLIDAIYMVTLLGLAIGSKLKPTSETENSGSEDSEFSNIGYKHKSLLLFLPPVLVLIFKGFAIQNMLVFILIIFIQEGLSSYIQAAIKNEQLLKREKDINIELEKRISERTKELVEKNNQLDFLSNQDTVTNLYNRRYFLRKLEEKLGQIPAGETLTLMFIDIDRFKTINDTYGHHVGDQVLIVVSQRLLSLKRPSTILARLGGDEFVFASDAKYGYKDAEKIAQQIISCCNEAIEIEQYSFHITISLGISIYPLDAQSSEALMKNADIAMYQAKKQGYNNYVSFNAQLCDTNRRKNEIELLLIKADFEKEFIQFYQPQFSIPDKKLVGMEALLRWNSPERGFISPAEFIPIAEETDQIIPIGQWVMKKAIKQIDEWNSKYSSQLKMGINVSPKQLDNMNFITQLKLAIIKRFVDPKWIDIEITEGVTIESEYRINEISSLFKGTGVSISIDDFGTGYSSLSYLKLFPFDRIKIAKPLIDMISKDDYDLQIVKAIIMLAKSIGIKTIAEGVESQDQFDILVTLGCEEIQGYLLGRPMPAREFEEAFLKNKDLAYGSFNPIKQDSILDLHELSLIDREHDN